jgi:hypothetical protein
LLRAGGWEPLFDGRTSRGWISASGEAFPESSWRIEDGCLRVVVERPTFQDLRTVREFGDFELLFEWKIAHGGNSGVKYLIHRFDAWTPPGAPRPHARARGYEYQLTDDANSAEAHRDATRATASLYSRLAPLDPPLQPAGAWNESRIVVRRPAVEHWLNGRKVVEATVEQGAPARSAISLQNHSSECWFRRIEVREL